MLPLPADPILLLLRFGSQSRKTEKKESRIEQDKGEKWQKETHNRGTGCHVQVWVQHRSQRENSEAEKYSQNWTSWTFSLMMPHKAKKKTCHTGLLKQNNFKQLCNFGGWDFLTLRPVWGHLCTTDLLFYAWSAKEITGDMLLAPQGDLSVSQ